MLQWLAHLPFARAHGPGRIALLLAIALGAAALSGCQSLSAATPEAAPAAATPARLHQPSEACLQALSAFVQTTTRRSVPLTELAFKDSDTLLLDHAQVRDAQGRLLNGMNLSQPVVFKLTRTAKGVCIAHHPGPDEKIVLPACECTASQPSGS